MLLIYHMVKDYLLNKSKHIVMFFTACIEYFNIVLVHCACLDFKIVIFIIEIMSG